MGFLRKAGEATNLITDHRFKDITSLSDAELLAAYRATRRSKASSATGIGLNSTISVANPFFAGAAVLNTYQFTVSSLNRKRVKEEVERRKALSKEFAQWFDEAAEGKKTKDLATGVAVKTALTTVSFGVVGFDSIGENFTEMFAGGPKLPPEQAALETAAEEAAWEAEHPNLAAIEDGREALIGGLPGMLVDTVNGEAAGHAIEQGSSWYEVAAFHDQGFSAPALGSQIVGLGAGSEMLQVPILVGEAAVYETLEDRNRRQAEQNGTNVRGNYGERKGASSGEKSG